MTADEPTVSRAPRRVVMSRRSPWRFHEPDAVIVDRRGEWGNPFRPEWDSRERDWVVTRDGRTVRRIHWTKLEATGKAVGMFRRAMSAGAAGVPTEERVRQCLGGRDLACWCPLWDDTTPCARCGGSGILLHPGPLLIPGGDTARCGRCDGTGDARYPCHADVLLRVANPTIVFPWSCHVDEA